METFSPDRYESVDDIPPGEVIALEDEGVLCMLRTGDDRDTMWMSASLAAPNVVEDVDDRR